MPAPSEFLDDRTPWFVSITRAAAQEAGAPADLLGDFAQQLVTALAGRSTSPEGFAAISELGGRAAEQGVSADAVVNLYLSLAKQLWRRLPAELRPRRAGDVHLAAEAVLDVTTNAIAALIAGHQIARQHMIRQEQTTRQEFLDDLLRGDADVARMVERAEPYGLDLTSAHHVALAAPAHQRPDIDRAALSAERSIVDAFGDRDVLVGTKDGRVVAIVPGPVGNAYSSSEATLRVARRLQAQIEQATPTRSAWRVGVGRAFPGSYGVARSYEEARDTLHLAEQLGVHPRELTPGDLLLHRVIGRDQAANVDLVRTVLSPLENARGGAEPLLTTLRAYFDSAHTATAAARRLHVSVRTVTYRLDRIRRLTGYDVNEPKDGLILQTAANGARLLNWPHHRLPASP